MGDHGRQAKPSVGPSQQAAPGAAGPSATAHRRTLSVIVRSWPIGLAATILFALVTFGFFARQIKEYLAPSVPGPSIPGVLYPDEFEPGEYAIRGTVGPIPKEAVGYRYVVKSLTESERYQLTPTTIRDTPPSPRDIPGVIRGEQMENGQYRIGGTIGPIPSYAAGREYIVAPISSGNGTKREYQLVLKVEL